MSYKLSNYCYKSTKSKYINNVLATASSEYTNNSKEILYGVTFDYYQLRRQSIQFASELLSRSSLNHKIICSTSDRKKQFRTYALTYCYSYVKALFYGIYWSRTKTIPDNSKCFIGHAILCNMLIKSTFVDNSENFTLYQRITLNESEREELHDRVLSKFKDFKSFETPESSGSYCFSHFEFENVLNALEFASSHIKGEDQYSTTNSFEPERQVQINSPESSQIEDNTQLTGNESENNRQTRGGMNPGRDVKIQEKGDRFIEIYNIMDPHVLGFLTNSYLPLGNSALNIVDKDSWYYCSYPGNTINYSLSYFLCRAVFIYLRPNKSNNSIGKYQQVFDLLPRNHRFDVFVNEEVRSVTYLRPYQQLYVDGLHPDSNTTDDYVKFLSKPLDEDFEIYGSDIFVDDILDPVEEGFYDPNLGDPEGPLLDRQKVKVIAKKTSDLVIKVLDTAKDLDSSISNLLASDPVDLKENFLKYSLDIFRRNKFSGFRVVKPRIGKASVLDSNFIKSEILPLISGDRDLFFDPINFSKIDAEESRWISFDKRLALQSDSKVDVALAFRMLSLESLYFHGLIDKEIFALEFSKLVLPLKKEWSLNYLPGRNLVVRLKSS